VFSPLSFVKVFEIVRIGLNTYSDAERRLTLGVKPRDQCAGRGGSEASPFRLNIIIDMSVSKLLEYSISYDR